jgi:hypothetical protein
MVCKFDGCHGSVVFQLGSFAYPKTKKQPRFPEISL